MQQKKIFLKLKQKNNKNVIRVNQRKPGRAFSHLQYRYSYFNSYYGLNISKYNKGKRFNKRIKGKKIPQRGVGRFTKKRYKKRYSKIVKRTHSFKFKRNLEINKKYLKPFIKVLVKRQRKLFKRKYYKYKIQNIYNYNIIARKRQYLTKRKVTKRLLLHYKKLNRTLKFKILSKKLIFKNLRIRRYKLFSLYIRNSFNNINYLNSRFFSKLLIKNASSNSFMFKLKDKVKFKLNTKRFKKVRLVKLSKVKYKITQKVRASRKFRIKKKKNKVIRKLYFLRTDFDNFGQKIHYKRKAFTFSLTNYYSKNLWTIQRNSKVLNNNLSNLGYFYYYKRNKLDKLLVDKLSYKHINSSNTFANREIINILKFILFLFFRVYLKESKLKINMRQELHNLRKINKQSKKSKLSLDTLMVESKNLKFIESLNKKYFIIKYKKYFLYLIIKLHLMLVNRVENKKVIGINKIIKNLIKFLIIPTAVDKKNINRKKFKRSNKIFYIFSQIILYNMKQLITARNYTINFFGVIEENINADILLKRILLTMDITKSLKWLILNMVRKLEKSMSFFGFKVRFAGRLSSSIMARVDVIQKGLISTNNMNVYIDYAKDSIVFKYGKCGIKVWLVRNLFVFMPYKYVYSYKFENNKN